MTVTEIIDGIIAKKNLIGMSNQQFADASGVPKTTIDRILRHETQNPSMQTILDMAAAVGFFFSNHPENTPALPAEDSIKDPMVVHLINVYEARGQKYEERIKRNTAHFNMLLAEKNRWLKFSMFLNIILVVFICAILLYDATHPDIGWIRDQLAAYTGIGMRDIMLAVQNFFGNDVGGFFDELC